MGLLVLVCVVGSCVFLFVFTSSLKESSIKSYGDIFNYYAVDSNAVFAIIFNYSPICIWLFSCNDSAIYNKTSLLNYCVSTKAKSQSNKAIPWIKLSENGEKGEFIIDYGLILLRAFMRLVGMLIFYSDSFELFANCAYYSIFWHYYLNWLSANSIRRRSNLFSFYSLSTY